MCLHEQYKAIHQMKTVEYKAVLPSLRTSGTLNCAIYGGESYNPTVHLQHRPDAPILILKAFDHWQL